MTIPMALLDLPFDGTLDGTNAVTGAVTADTTGTVTFDTPNHDSSGGYAAVGDPGTPGGIVNLYRDPGFESQLFTGTDAAGGRSFAYDYPYSGGVYLRANFFNDGDYASLYTDELALAPSTAITVSFWGRFYQQDAAEVMTHSVRVFYDDYASFDDFPIDDNDTVESDYSFHTVDIATDASKTANNVQIRTVVSGTVSFAQYWYDDPVIEVDIGPGTDPTPGTLSIPTVSNVTDNAGALAFWVQGDGENYWNDVTATDPYPLLTITTESDEASRWAIEWDRGTSSLIYRNIGSDVTGELDLATDDLDWHLVILNYDSGNYSTYFDNVLAFTSFGDGPLPTDGDIYLLSSPYHDRFGGHVSNVQTFSDALTPPQRQYLWDGTTPPPPERIGGLVRTGPPPLNIGLTRTAYSVEPIAVARHGITEPLATNRDGPPVSIVITSTPEEL